MAVQEVVRDLPPRPLAPVDESVVIPEAVRRAGAAAEAIHAQQYQPEPPAPPDPPPPPPEPPAQPDPPEPPAPPDPPAPPAGDAVPSGEEIRGDVWAGRYNSMKGRYEQSQENVRSLQEQITELGDELMRTQHAMTQPRPPAEAPDQPQPARRLITAEDEQTYGPDFIDLARRAGLEAVQPELAALRTQSVELQKRLRTATRQTVGQLLDTRVPSWRQIMASARWKQWMRLPDVYSGRVRKGLLDAAFQAADAPRVVAFFQGFLNEERAAGHIADPVPLPPEPPAPVPQPREPAVPLATLAAPGRATRPAQGVQPEQSADKPIFTRKQIADFYTAVRQGRYTGRETEKVRQEGEIFAAQREGRIR